MTKTAGLGIDFNVLFPVYFISMVQKSILQGAIKCSRSFVHSSRVLPKGGLGMRRLLSAITFRTIDSNPVYEKRLEFLLLRKISGFSLSLSALERAASSAS